MEFQLLEKTKMLENKACSCLQTLNCWHFNIHEHDKFHVQLSIGKVYNLGASIVGL